VVNLGVPGYSTEQTLRLLEDVGWAYEPDLLIVHNIFSDCNIDAFQDEGRLGPGRFPRPRPYAAPYTAHDCTARCICPGARHQATLNQETGRVLMPGIPTGANAAVGLREARHRD
jgi:hypothetical protein